MELCRASALCVWPRRSLCRGPARSVSGPGALCVGARRSLCRAPALSVSVSGPGALCVGPWRSLCRGGALCRAALSVSGPALSVSRPGALSLFLSLSVSGPGVSVSGPGVVCVGPRRCLCQVPALSDFVSGPGALVLGSGALRVRPAILSRCLCCVIHTVRGPSIQIRLHGPSSDPPPIRSPARSIRSIGAGSSWGWMGHLAGGGMARGIGAEQGAAHSSQQQTAQLRCGL